MEKPKAGSRYQHYKGAIYTVIGVGRHTETEEDMVIYSDSKAQVWLRPLAMFQETVAHEQAIVPRFQLLP